MKILNKIICLCGAVIMPFSTEASALSEKKVITEIDTKGNQTEILSNTVWVRFKSGISSANAINSLSKSNAKFKLEPILPPIRISNINERINSGKIDQSTANSPLFKSEEALSRTYILQYEEDISPINYIQKVLAYNSEIEIAEPYYIYELQKSPTAPNDPLLASQVTFERMKVKEAWQAGLIGSPNTIIAISDNGFSTDHEDLSANIGYNSDEIPNNGIDDDGNGYIDDYAGYNFSYISDAVAADNVYHPDSHGTTVAGIAAATTDNGKGISGVANQCKYFPLKIAFKSSAKVAFGYQSIIYAAENGIPVINCSWGRVKPYSQVEQDIITYAIAKGVSIVAASGNTGLGVERSDIFYPANYDGVLGVGEVNIEDRITLNNTTLSLQTKIMASGLNNVSCVNSETNNTYESLGVGTSYASPIIAGFLGLIRSKYPELNAREAIEFARLCTDDVSGNNYGYTAFLPGRVNMLKAVELSPMSIPSIRPLNLIYTNYQEQIIERFTDTNQIINLKIEAFNYLGAADNLKFKLEFLGDPSGIEIINDEIGINQVSAKSPVELIGFKFRIKGEQPDLTALKIIISQNDKAIDFFTVPIICNNDVTTFENNKLVFSVSDYGRFGSSINRKIGEGNGFSPKSSYNMLHQNAGLILCIDRTYPFSSLYGEYYRNSDFTPIKRFTAPDSSFGSLKLMTDYGYSIVVNSRYSFLDDNSAVVKCEYEVESINDKTVDNLSVGLLFDWDMPPKVLENSSKLFYDAIPDEAPLSGTVAQIIQNYDATEFIGTLAFSTETGTIAQSAAIPSSDNLSYQDLIDLLNNGIATQYEDKMDVMTSTGMKFIGRLAPNTKRRFTVLIAYSKNKTELASMLRTAYTQTADVTNTEAQSNIIYPNPAIDQLYIASVINPNPEIEIYNSTGELIPNTLYNYELNKALASGNNSDVTDTQTIQLNIQHLTKGAYLLLIDGVYSGAFVKK